MKVFCTTTVALACLSAIEASILSAAPDTRDAALDDKSTGDSGESAASAELPLAQEQVLKKYQRFEEVLLRMSELTAASDPKRAALLRKAVGQSKDKMIGVQVDRVIDLLKRDQLATAVNNQKDVEKDLKQLLDLLLSEQRADRLKSERERIKDQIRRLNELINKQQQLEGQTQGTADPKKLAESQGKLGQQTGKLADEMKDPAEESSKAADDKSTEKPSTDENADREVERPNGDPQKGEQQNGEGEPSKQESDQQEKSSKSGDSKSPKEKQPDQPSDDKRKPSDDSPPEEKQEQQGKSAEGQQQHGKQQQGQQQQGQPQDGQQQSDQEQSQEEPPASDSEMARRRVREAQKAMDEAKKKLEQAHREGAAEDQEEARRKLEQAKARLEEVLRQLREEEVERSLALLEARFRKMLDMQTEVYEGTVRVDRVKPEERTHNEEIEAGRLSRRQRAILDELTGAETLLREDGTSVAFPEAVQELREDMEQVAARLAEAKVDQMTQLTEQDIMSALEEMIAAFQKAKKENEEKKQQQQQQQQGADQDPPLVDAIAELKMIRALQMRVNKRTVNYSKLVDGDEGQADKAEVLQALEKLSEREQRIYRTTRDIVIGKNQ